MGLEIANFIPELVPTNPDGADNVSAGDDHLRTLKTAILGSFPAFVGDTATPKSVTLTEDEINDAAQKAAAAIISGAWEFTTSPKLANAVPFLGRDFADANDVELLEINAGDLCLLGSNLFNGRVQSLSELLFRVGGSNIARVIPRADGAMEIRDRSNVYKQVAFRNPGFNNQTGAYTLLQTDEGQLVRKGSGVAATITVPTLDEFTSITVMNESANDLTLAESGVTLKAFLGGSNIGSPLTIAPDSIVQLYWRSTLQVSVWGNGIS